MKLNRGFISSCTMLYCLSFCLTDSESAGQAVKAVVGENVTLPCAYDVGKHGVSDACWGRGDLPNSKCSNKIISTDGHNVINRQSDRYQLLSELSGGNISLTIINVKEDDSGIYGCRVEISGLFNDQKEHVVLTVEQAPTVATPPFTTVTRTDKCTAVINTGLTSTASQDTFTSSGQNSTLGRGAANRDATLNSTIVSLLLAAVFLAVLVLTCKKWMNSKAQSGSDTCPAVSQQCDHNGGLQNRDMAIYNIYEFEE